MRNLRTHINTLFILWISGILLISVSGVQMHYFQCKTSGDSEYLVSIAGTSNYSTDDVLNCSCSLDEALNQICENCQAYEPKSPGINDCCDNSSIHLQLEIEYLFVSTNKIEMPKEISLFNPASVLLVENNVNGLKPQFSPFPDRPLFSRYSGKHLVIFYRQLKIPSA